MLKKLFVLFLFIPCYYFSQIQAITSDKKKVILYENGTWVYVDEQKPLFQYLPQVSSSDIIIHHTEYSLAYDTLHHLAKWTIYQITKEQIQKKGVKRTNRFLPDPLLYEKTNLEKDYENSGYDRGHLIPAADMSYSDITMKESFYYSNITPQLPSFNRGIWKKLEDQVRKWVIENEQLIVISGPIISDTLKHFGIHKISKPYYFYKIIADFTKPDIKAISFIIPNESCNKDLKQYTISIDSIEKVTHINFFPTLNDQIEEKLEAEKHINKWFKD